MEAVHHGRGSPGGRRGSPDRVAIEGPSAEEGRDLPLGGPAASRRRRPHQARTGTL